MQSFKFTPTKSMAAAIGAAATLAGVVVAAPPADAAYAATCSTGAFNQYRGDTYSLTCSHFGASAAGSVYSKVVKGRKSTTYVLGRFHADRSGAADTGYIVSGKLPLGVNSIHVAGGGKVFSFNIRVHRA